MQAKVEVTATATGKLNTITETLPIKFNVEFTNNALQIFGAKDDKSFNVDPKKEKSFEMTLLKAATVTGTQVNGNPLPAFITIATDNLKVTVKIAPQTDVEIDSNKQIDVRLQAKAADGKVEFVAFKITLDFDAYVKILDITQPIRSFSGKNFAEQKKNGFDSIVIKKYGKTVVGETW